MPWLPILTLPLLSAISLSSSQQAQGMCSADQFIVLHIPEALYSSQDAQGVSNVL